MAEGTREGKRPDGAARRDRLAAELRANLKKRKARARDGEPKYKPEHPDKKKPQ